MNYLDYWLGLSLAKLTGYQQSKGDVALVMSKRSECLGQTCFYYSFLSSFLPIFLLFAQIIGYMGWFGCRGASVSCAWVSSLVYLLCRITAHTRIILTWEVAIP